MPAAKTTASAAAPSAKNVSMTPAMQTSGKPVAKVNGAVLTDRELLAEMYSIFPYAQQHNGFPKELEPQIRSGALQMIIFEELVYQEAKRRNMTIPPAKLNGAEAELQKKFPNEAAYKAFVKTEANGSQAALREQIRRAMLIEALLNQEVDKPSMVTAAQAKAQYDKNLTQYKHGEKLQIQSISIMPPNQTPAVQKEAKQRAEDAFKQAKQAKTYHEFGLLAEKFSDDDFHVNMGDHKQQDASALPPPIVKAAQSMKVGEVSDLIQLDNAYTIFRLEARVPAGTTPFADVKTQLQADMQKEKTQQLRSALNQKLRKTATIETCRTDEMYPSCRRSLLGRAGFLLVLIVLAGSAANAQISVGDNTSMSMNGQVGAGYGGSFGNIEQTAHNIFFTGQAQLNGFYYNPKFLSFNVSPFYNRSQDNSAIGTVFNASGLDASVNLFGGSHFPGSVGFGKAWQDGSQFQIAGQPGLSSNGVTRNFTVSWGAYVPHWPTLTATYFDSSLKQNIIGETGTTSNSERA